MTKGDGATTTAGNGAITTAGNKFTVRPVRLPALGFRFSRSVMACIG